MNKLQKKNNEEYSFVLKEYTKLLSGFLLKKPVEEPYFVGGIPITLERQYFSDLLDKSYKTNDYKYTATAKVDGTRFMLFICESSPVAEKKTFYFIDRDLNIYNLVNKEGRPLEKSKLPKMLLDGEMIFYKDRKSYYNLPQTETDFLSFMVFDILFGPPDLYFNDIFTEQFPRFKESVAMSGPIGSKMWDYKSRYSVLAKMFIPSQQNNQLPPLALSVLGSSFFRIELKQIVSVGDFKDHKVPKDYIYKSFKETRKDYYAFLNKRLDPKDKKGENLNNSLGKIKVDFDGLIFTPIDTGYVFGNWNEYKNYQYKWKPSEEQTVDFAIENTNLPKVELEGKMYSKVKIYFKARDRNSQDKKEILVQYKSNKNTTALIPAELDIPDKTIVEFNYMPGPNYFIFSRVRQSLMPNSIRSIMSVIKNVDNPIDINILHKIMKSDSSKTSGETMKLLKDYLTKEQLNKILLCAGVTNLVPVENQNVIEKELETYNEFDNFRVNILGTDFTKYKAIPEILNWKSETEEFVYLKENKKTTAYKFIPELKDLVRIYTYEEKSKNELLINNPVSEKFEINKTTNGNSLEHLTFDKNGIRIEIETKVVFYDPNGKINMVHSSIFRGKNENNQIIKEFTYPPRVSFYFEVNQENKVNTQELINFLKFYINF